MKMVDEKIIELIDTLKANNETMKNCGISDNLWGKAVEYIEFLQAENSELHKKLYGATNVPVKVGDIIYCIYGHGIISPELVEWKIVEIRLYENQYIVICGHPGTNDIRAELDRYYKIWWFADRIEAENRLVELNGGAK